MCGRLWEAASRSVPHTAKPENLLSIRDVRMENALLMTHGVCFFLRSVLGLEGRDRRSSDEHTSCSLRETCSLRRNNSCQGWDSEAHGNVLCQPDLRRLGLQYKRAFCCVGWNRSSWGAAVLYWQSFSHKKLWEYLGHRQNSFQNHANNVWLKYFLDLAECSNI